MRIYMRKQGTGAPRYTLSTSPVNVITEGLSLTINVTTENVPDNTIVPYTITGISQSDLSSGNLTGTVTILSGTASVVLELLSDLITEGPEVLTFSLDNVNASIAVTISDDIRGGVVFTSTGTHTWTVPDDVYSISAVCVGGGGSSPYRAQYEFGAAGGGGGGLGWKNNISVTPGQEITVVVGSSSQPSYVIDLSTVAGLGGTSSTARTSVPGGGFVGDGGGNGGASGASESIGDGGGGAGAGGYSGNGGAGGRGATWGYSGPTSANNGYPGNGGGGGGGAGIGFGGGGGGVGLYGQGSNGGGGSGYLNGPAAGGPGGGGSGGSVGGRTRSQTTSSPGGGYGGGAGGALRSDYNARSGGSGAPGAVRIIWGSTRSFPSTDVNTAENETVI